MTAGRGRGLALAPVEVRDRDNLGRRECDLAIRLLGTEPNIFTAGEAGWMRMAVRLARRGYGRTSPNPMVGAALVKRGRLIGQGWHHRAGEAHAEILALRDAQARGRTVAGATLYVTLEPCSTHGRTPPCTQSLIAAGVGAVVAATTDANPAHAGRGLAILQQAGLEVRQGLLAETATELNEAFNHWIVKRTPLVTVKAAMTLDGKIATTAGESKWITGTKARSWAMRMRQGADAVLVGINTVLADDPRLTARSGQARGRTGAPPKRRIILDSLGRTPPTARVLEEGSSAPTIVVVGNRAPKRRLEVLAGLATVWVAPARAGKIDLRWLLDRLGAESVTSLLVEGGGEVNASFLEQRLAHRVAFFYAPKILGGEGARKAVAGNGAVGWPAVLRLEGLRWRRLGPDLLLTARVADRGVA